MVGRKGLGYNEIKSRIHYSNELIISDKLSVYYYATSNTLIIKWVGKVSSLELRNGYAQVLKIVEQYRPDKWLLDLSKRERVRKADQKWVFENVFAKSLKMLDSDIFISVVLSVYAFRELVGQLNGDEMIQNGNLLVMQDFLYEEEAWRWLQTVAPAVVERA